MSLTVTEPTFAPGAASDCTPSVGRSQCVVVHSGARDGYQLARALSDVGMLETLVTDLFWPSGLKWAETLSSLLPSRLTALLSQRNEPHIPWSRVKLCSFAGLITLVADKLPRMPFAARRAAARHADGTLGSVAGKLAARTGSGLISYSYYGFEAFTAYARPGILFQLHPHPLSMRRILTEELNAHPDCAESLRQEWELALPEKDFQRLVQETAMPAHILAASSFTRSTLVENGTPASQITVLPYGVDSQRFKPPIVRDSGGDSRLQLLFVGRINQRKGIKYLLEALKLLHTGSVKLTVCGRVVDGLDLFKPFASQVEIRPSISQDELVAAYQNADLFVFPSVAEGFGQVLLESLACGLPVLSTTHTAAPDLVTPGVEGFVVEPRRPDLLAERIDWALTHRNELHEMRYFARQTAMQFTWHRFRAGVVEAVRTQQQKGASYRHA